jgi:serine phosphatase RsbU (regulator of sigma subunit)
LKNRKFKTIIADIFEMGKQRTTIFNQLILNVVTPVVIGLLVLAVFNYIHNKNLLVNTNTFKNKLISDEIKSILQFQDFSLELIDNNLYSKMERYSNEIVDKHFADTRSIESADLRLVQEKLGMNPQLEDIYVISSNGIVVNTTFDKDKGLNFFSFGEEHKNYLLKILNSGKFESERVSIEASTGRLKKYSYQATKDKKYIIEIGLYSEQATNIVDMFKKQLNEIAMDQEGFLSVDFFISAETPVSFNNNNASIKENHKEAFLKTFKEKTPHAVVETEGGKKLHSEYIYMDRKNTELYKGAVIRIVSDRSEEDEILRRELTTFFILFGITILSLMLVIFQKTKLITSPIKKLVENINRIREGDFKERAQVEGNNEITTLSEQYNLMLEKIEEYYSELEQKVIERTAQISRQKDEIEEQKKQIMDSIHYARRIQNAILPSDEFIKKVLPDSFVLYKPKDIVSGDFYWVSEKEGKAIFAVVDCTGHGVPGAFMSIVGSNNLNYAVNVVGARKPSDVLDALNQGVTNSLNQREASSSIKDGMDIALCTVDFKSKKMQFAGAYNPAYHVRNNVLTEISGDKFPIGAFLGEELKKFKNHELELQKDDTIYIFSDGYKDQFGGEQGKKFLAKRFRDLIIEISHKPMAEQKETLDKTIEFWMRDHSQVDDILVMGVKI